MTTDSAKGGPRISVVTVAALSFLALLAFVLGAAFDRLITARIVIVPGAVKTLPSIVSFDDDGKAQIALQSTKLCYTWPEADYPEARAVQALAGTPGFLWEGTHPDAPQAVTSRANRALWYTDTDHTITSKTSFPSAITAVTPVADNGTSFTVKWTDSAPRTATFDYDPSAPASKKAQARKARALHWTLSTLSSIKPVSIHYEDRTAPGSLVAFIIPLPSAASDSGPGQCE